MKNATWQYFTLEEYQGRLDALRARMEAKGVDCMMVHTPENLYYLTGYQTPGYYWYQTLIVTMDREPVFITRLLENSNVEHLTWVEDSRPYGDSDDWVARTRDTLEDLGMGSKRIGVEMSSWFITIQDYNRLKGMMPNANVGGLLDDGGRGTDDQVAEGDRIHYAGSPGHGGGGTGGDRGVGGRSDGERGRGGGLCGAD